MGRNVTDRLHPAALPGPLAALAAAYFLATLAHFSHNAEYIAFYPGMPASLTRETVYLAWLGVTAIGVLGFVVLRLGFAKVAVALLGLYGAFGLDALLHYTLALCSEHTLAANLTIWSEAVLGLSLLLTSAVLLGRRLAAIQK
jgi:uncharacterized membrane protein